MSAHDCTERCARLHPHCALELSRAIAPDDSWFWSVTMPDGHIWASKGGMRMEEAVASMSVYGFEQYMLADRAWRGLASPELQP